MALCPIDKLSTGNGSDIFWMTLFVCPCSWTSVEFLCSFWKGHSHSLQISVKSYSALRRCGVTPSFEERSLGVVVVGGVGRSERCQVPLVTRCEMTWAHCGTEFVKSLSRKHLAMIPRIKSPTCVFVCRYGIVKRCCIRLVHIVSILSPLWNSILHSNQK